MGVSALVMAGCGSDNGSGSPAATTTSEQKPATKKEVAPARTGTTVKVIDSKFGRILADGTGKSFYVFDKEKSKASECYGDCASAWPPVLTKGLPKAGSGARETALGTTRRRDGKLQVTFAGRPMYYYHADSPGTILCHNVKEFGGLWLVVRPNGKAVS
jgi:predicted lipoprotein with Yx(FWY)xxD motif